MCDICGNQATIQDDDVKFCDTCWEANYWGYFGNPRENTVGIGRRNLLVARALLLLKETLEAVTDVRYREPSDIADISLLLTDPSLARWVPLLKDCQCPQHRRSANMPPASRCNHTIR